MFFFAGNDILARFEQLRRTVEGLIADRQAQLEVAGVQSNEGI